MDYHWGGDFCRLRSIVHRRLNSGAWHGLWLFLSVTILQPEPLLLIGFDFAWLSAVISFVGLGSYTAEVAPII